MPTHQVLIASYAKDFPWLLHCLASLRIFDRGFLPPVIVVPSHDRTAAHEIVAQSYPATQIMCLDGPTDNPWGRFLRAQIAMMMGDVFCPDADFVHLLGSDCFIKGQYFPNDQMHEGKPVMLFNSYAILAKDHPATLHWRAGTQHALRIEVKHEFMRRLPLVYPRELYPAVRQHVEAVHKMPFERYVYSRAAHRNHSESNILGAYAYAYMHDRYHWVNLDRAGAYEEVARQWPSPVIQFWSHGGMDRPADCGHDYHTLTGKSNTLGKTPREVMNDIYAWARSPGVIDPNNIQ